MQINVGANSALKKIYTYHNQKEHHTQQGKATGVSQISYKEEKHGIHLLNQV